MIRTLLLATDRKFWRDDRGSRARIASLCRHFLGRGMVLHVFFVGDMTPGDLKRLRARFPAVHLHAVHPLRLHAMVILRQLGARLARIGTRIRRWVRRSAGPRVAVAQGARARPSQPPAERTLADFRSAPAQSAFQTICRRLKPGAVIVEYVRRAYLIEGLGGGRDEPSLTLIDTLDVMSDRCRRYRERGEAHWINISEAEEKQVLARFDVIVAIQPSDAARFREMLPQKRVVTAMHASPILLQPPREREPVRMLYLATGDRVNLLAIESFLAEVWPSLSERLADRARLLLAGNICKHFDPVVLPPGVDLAGYVEDLNALYGETHIVVNPVAFGGGLKIKNVEALCRAKPLVTTPAGAQGIEDGAEEAFQVCDSPDGMVDALTALVERPELRARMAEKAHRFALDHFSEDKAYAELDALLGSAANA